MSKLIMAFPPQQSPRRTSDSSAYGPGECSPSNASHANAEYQGKLIAVLAACLLVQTFSFASLANAFQEFDQIGVVSPVCENCAQNSSAPQFEQTHIPMLDTYSQTFDPGLGYQSEIVSGVEQVSYDAPLPVQDYVQETIGVTQIEQSPSAQIYSSYPGVPNVIQQPSYDQTFTSSPTTSVSSGNVQPGLAQQKAVQAAQSGMRGHLGGGLGGAKYEGVGWSNYSAQNAIKSCCYWGVRPTAQIGVSKGNDGFWYACVLYN